MSTPRIIHRAALLLSAAAATCTFTAAARADETAATAQFALARTHPGALRQFLVRFPKGGDLHNHLGGSIYAEHIIHWAADDGKCVLLSSGEIVLPPCDALGGRPPVAQVLSETDRYRALIDLYSMRNYERRPASGHDHFFNTFDLFFRGTEGHEGAMIAEAAQRRGRENTVYLELLQSWGMAEAAGLAAAHPGLFSHQTPIAQLRARPDLLAIAARATADLSRYEQDWRTLSGCEGHTPDAGCGVTVRYLAQVIRTDPPEQVYAQIVLGFLLADRDARYVGVNLVAPEDDPAALADYDAQMQEIRDLSQAYPQVKVTLHAGEFGPGLVPPEYTRDHIGRAVRVAGALRIGHGVDIGMEDDAIDLLREMARRRILVEINLTSNAVINGVAGPEHPFLLYRRFHVPLALSADDEGVLRIDLTHEYVRAALSYGLSYADLKELSRNALAYGFVPGAALLADTRTGRRVAECRDQAAAACTRLLAGSEKARLQSELERRFRAFEAAAH